MGLKKLIWLLSGLLALLSLFLAVGVITGGAEGFAYVISGSMEPTLHVGDGFVLWPVRNPQVGDVISYRPVAIKAETVTHRIVGEAPLGFMTRGDNNPETDQAGGEPPVTRERILGRVVTIDGHIVRIPRLGPISEWMRNLLQRRLWVVALAVVGISFLLGLVDQSGSVRRRQPRRRWRLGLVYRAVMVGAVGGLLLSMLMSVQIQQVEYLVTVDPGDVADHVPVGVPGAVRLKVAGGGLLPVFSFGEGIAPAAVTSAPALLGPRSAASLVLQTPAHMDVGWYRDYVRLYRYPTLLPRWVVAALHRQSPYLAMAGVASAFAGILWLVGRFLNKWTPMRAMADRRTQRVLRRKLRMKPTRRRAV